MYTITDVASGGIFNAPVTLVLMEELTVTETLLVWQKQRYTPKLVWWQ